MTKEVDNFFDRLGEEISTISKSVGIGGHAGTTGTNREELIKDFLIDLLPKYFQYGKGIIIDGKGNKSNQQDIIIYSPFISIFSEKSSFYPLDSVSSVIEVKSNLNKSDLEDAMKKIAILKNMKYSITPEKRSGSWREYVQCNIFSYTGSNINTLIKNIIDIQKKHGFKDKELFDNLCVNEKYFITNNLKIKKMLGEEHAQYSILTINKKSLPYFLDCMLNTMNIPLSPVPIFIKYLGEFKIDHIKWPQN
ncbi:MAG: hypothetical protein IIA87_04935 [Nanoarchaeota archaeon]|nr:hypothetical protein [Nanoarchaeota archaeon]